MKKISLLAMLTAGVVVSSGVMAAPLTLDPDAIAAYAEMPKELQPILPMDRQFSFQSSQSTQLTARSLDAYDDAFVTQTIDKARVIGALQLLILANEAFDDKTVVSLDNESMYFIGLNKIIHYLSIVNPDGVNNFINNYIPCMEIGSAASARAGACNLAISDHDLIVIMRMVKAELKSKIS